MLMSYIQKRKRSDIARYLESRTEEMNSHYSLPRQYRLQLNALYVCFEDWPVFVVPIFFIFCERFIVRQFLNTWYLFILINPYSGQTNEGFWKEWFCMRSFRSGEWRYRLHCHYWLRSSRCFKFMIKNVFVFYFQFSDLRKYFLKSLLSEYSQHVTLFDCGLTEIIIH